jgi:hypothetical protein
MSKEQRTTDETDCFRQVHEAGDPFVVDQCVIWCKQTGSQLPSWAFDIVAERSVARIDNVDRELRRKFPGLPPLFEALIDVARSRMDRGGRGRELDFVRGNTLIGFIEAARYWGHTVESACELAVARVAEYGFKYTLESAKRVYSKRARRLWPPDSMPHPFWTIDLAEWEARAKKT